MSGRKYQNMSYLFYGHDKHDEHCSEILLDVGNCSQAYIDKLRELDEELWGHGTLSMYLLFGACVFTNCTTLLVFFQGKYKAKLVPSSLTFIYVTNILYVGVLAFTNLGTPFVERPGFDGNMYCKCSYFMACFLRGVTNWTLMLVSLIHVTAIYFPDNFTQFRKNPKNSWVVFTIALLVSSVLTIVFSKWHELKTCQFYEKKFCTFPSTAPLWHMSLSLVTPMFVTLLCSISIAYSICNPDSTPFTGIEMRTGQRLNRLIIGSTLLFIASHIPLLIYIRLQEVEYDDIACTFFYYRRHLRRLTTLTLTMISFSFDSLLFIIISGPFRRDVVHIYKYIICCGRKQRSIKYHSKGWGRGSSGPRDQTMSRGSKTTVRFPARRRSSFRALSFKVEKELKLGSSASSTSV